jgi:cathepsin D
MINSSRFLFFLSGVTVNGKTVNIGNGNSAAIDTGTTLIGAPTAAVNAIWSAVSGAKPLSGQFAGFWAFRTSFLDAAGTHKGVHKGLLIFFCSVRSACTTQFTISMSFGGPSWPISIDDLNLGTIGGGQCLGAIFDVTEGTDISSQGNPAWIVGDTFLVRFPSSASF